MPNHVQYDANIQLNAQPTDALHAVPKGYADSLGVFPCTATLVSGEEEDVLNLAANPPAAFPETLAGVMVVTFISPAAYAAGMRVAIGETQFTLIGTDGEPLRDDAWGEDVAVQLTLDNARARAFFTRSGDGGGVVMWPHEFTTDGVSTAYEVTHNLHTMAVFARVFEQDTQQRREWNWRPKNPDVVVFETDLVLPAGLKIGVLILADTGGGVVENITAAQFKAALDSKADADEMNRLLEDKAAVNHPHPGMVTDSILTLALKEKASEKYVDESVANAVEEVREDVAEAIAVAKAEAVAEAASKPIQVGAGTLVNVVNLATSENSLGIAY